MNFSLTDLWTKMKSGDVQVCPPFENFPKHIFLQVAFRSAVLSTIVQFFPPSSKIQGVRFLAAANATNLPISEPPVKTMLSTPGCAVRVPAVLTPPCNTR